jgi:outer membrane receptor protein involved in Fe transport
MALTKVSGGILDPGINVAGIVTATGFDGPFTGGSSSNINAGIITATGFDLNGNGDISGNLVIDGNLTANGDFTTLNTTLREVEILRVDANTTAVAGIITQTGAGDLLRLYDGTSQVVTVDDEGNVGLGSATPSEKLDVVGVTSFTGDVMITQQYFLVVIKMHFSHTMEVLLDYKIITVISLLVET